MWADKLRSYLTTFGIAWGIGSLLRLGLVRGMIPAIRASRLDPMDALRYE